MKLGSDIAAVVTGGASGLGEATARRLGLVAQDSGNLVITTSRMPTASAPVSLPLG